MNRVLLAQALDWSPANSSFRDLIAASARYGFTKGTYNSETIELTELGERLTKPRSEDERLDALREGMRNIPIFNQLLTHFANNKLPQPDFLKNTLERAPFEIAPERSKEVSEFFTKSGRQVGFIRTVSNAPWVILEAGRPEDPADAEGDGTEQLEMEPPAVAPPSGNGHTMTIPPLSVDGAGVSPSTARTAPVAPTVPAPSESPSNLRQFFIAHGWDTDALAQLQKVLKGFDIPFVVAQDEPNVGRPISEKVRDLMKSCSAGIFIFSADEEFKDKDGNTIWRPRENVIYELGAASLEYGRRIVIFKEKSVHFPSDYRDLGYIEYEKGNLQGKAMDLLKELIALKAVKIMAGA